MEGKTHQICQGLKTQKKRSLSNDAVGVDWQRKDCGGLNVPLQEFGMAWGGADEEEGGLKGLAGRGESGGAPTAGAEVDGDFLREVYGAAEELLPRSSFRARLPVPPLPLALPKELRLEVGGSSGTDRPDDED